MKTYNEAIVEAKELIINKLDFLKKEESKISNSAYLFVNEEQAIRISDHDMKRTHQQNIASIDLNNYISLNYSEIDESLESELDLLSSSEQKKEYGNLNIWIINEAKINNFEL